MVAYLPSLLKSVYFSLFLTCQAKAWVPSYNDKIPVTALYSLAKNQHQGERREQNYDRPEVAPSTTTIHDPSSTRPNSIRRTVTISDDMQLTVFEWERPASIVEEYWEVTNAQQSSSASSSPAVTTSVRPHDDQKKPLDPFGLVTWPGAVVAAQELLQHRQRVHNQHVLVLGAGVGMEAQAAALVGAASVLATDVHPTTLELLNMGVHEAGLKSVITTALFDFGSTAQPLPHCDVLIAADVLYNDVLAGQLIRRCVEARQRTPPPIILITDSQRFVDHFESDINQHIPKIKGEAVLHWEERYLHKFTGSGILVDEDQTYDVKARVMWIGIEES